MSRLLAAWLLAIVFVLLAGCAPDPRSQAEADATRLAAESRAASEEQARQQQQATFELEHAEQEARSAQWVASWNAFVHYFMICATVAASIAILGVGAGTAWGSVGIGRAVANVALVRSNLIHMDKATRSYPLVTYVGKGVYALGNPNHESVLLLDSKKDADRQALLSMGAVQLAGMVAYEARHHKTDPTGVAMVGTNPSLPDARLPLPTGGLIETGKWAGAQLLTQED